MKSKLELGSSFIVKISLRIGSFLLKKENSLKSIRCADMEIIHDIVAVKPLDGYRVGVVFDTGEHGVFDCTRYLEKPYWRRLKDLEFFRQVHVDYGTLVWPDDIDIGPEDVWEFAERTGQSD